MIFLTQDQRAIARELVAIGDVEDSPEDWAQRLEALLRRAGLGEACDRFAPLVGAYLGVAGACGWDEPAITGERDQRRLS